MEINTQLMSAYAVGIPVIALLIAVEAIYSAWMRKGYYDKNDSIATTGMFIGNVMITGAMSGTALAVYLFMYERRIFDLTFSLPQWFQWILIFFAIDFVTYWWHRANHRVGFLWALHISHHSSTHMNFLVSLRQPWLAPIFKIPFYATIPLVGFDPSMLAVAGVAATVWGLVGHTKAIPRLPEPIEFVFNTPSAHRVHHGSNPEYIDKNYGNIFMLWDHMFGTYQKEEAPVVYGLTKNVDNHNPFVLTFKPYAELFYEVFRSGSFKRAVRVLVRPPG